MNISEDKTVFSVSEIVNQAKELMEQAFNQVWIEGELSNLVKHSSGHWYFTLKDDKSQLKSAMFRGSNRLIRFDVEDGLKIRALGRLSVYEARGDFQMVVEVMEPAGLGPLQLAYEQLKKRLYQEGLFDSKRKRQLPRFPKRVAVITSPTGAAIQDILNVIGRRSPLTAVDLYPVRVQGQGAAEEIVNAIKRLNKVANWDVIICGRGGGSIEDLWAFNEESVARAIAHSVIPIISAVGHEIDYTIADFVADVRAETPTAAAEMVVQDKRSLHDEVFFLTKQLGQLIRTILSTYRYKLEKCVSAKVLKEPWRAIEPLAQKNDDLKHRLVQLIKQYKTNNEQKFTNLMSQLHALSPLNVMARGYSLVYKNVDGMLIKEAGQLKVNDQIEIKFRKGKIKAKVETVE